MQYVGSEVENVRYRATIEFFNGNTSFQLPATHRRPTADMEEKLRLIQLFPLRCRRPREIYMET